MKEIWKSINGFEGRYEVSSVGRIRSLSTDKIHKGMIRKLVKRNDYLVVTMKVNKVTTGASVHRLVAMAFIPNPENKPCVNHKNGNKLDNRVCNLEWCTYRENNKHARVTGLNRPGERKGSRLKEKDIPPIRRLAKSHNIGQIAKIFKVSHGCIAGVINGRSWKHIK